MNAITREDDLTPEQSAAQLLAYYDARGVKDDQLCKIFRCTAADLLEARTGEDYEAYLGAEVQSLEANSTAADDSWDALEVQALANMREQMHTISDPRMLLGIAVKANQAGRRRFNHAAPGTKAAGGAVIDVNAGVGQEKVVRLRTRFLARLQQEDGTQVLIERQQEVTATAQGDLEENLTPKDVQRMLSSSLGVTTAELRSINRFGVPDSLDLDFTDYEAE